MNIPSNALVVLVGPAGAGKSTFAREHFAPTQIVSSDRCRALVGDDEADQSVSADAFLLLRTLVRLRLRLGRLTVVDSTALLRRHRASLLRIARAAGAPAVAILFDVDAATCKQRNLARDRRVPDEVIDLHRAQFLRARTTVGREGFATVHVLRDGFDRSRSLGSIPCPASTDRCTGG